MGSLPTAPRSGLAWIEMARGLLIHQVQLDASGIRVTATGWFLVRAVAMVFDRYLQADRNRARFSRII